MEENYNWKYYQREIYNNVEIMEYERYTYKMSKCFAEKIVVTRC